MLYKRLQFTQRRNGCFYACKCMTTFTNNFFVSANLIFLNSFLFISIISFSSYAQQSAQNKNTPHSDTVYKGIVTTNISLFRQLDDWRDGLLDKQAKDVAADIDSVMSGDIVPWRIPVYKAESWQYQWGYLAWLTKAWALSWSGRKEAACEALINATAYMPKTPPPRPYDYHYYRWYLTMGQIYSTFGRFYDAETYFTKIRNEMTTNDVLYYEATAELAHVYGKQGRYREELSFLDEYFSLVETPSGKALHSYIRGLFALGRYEQGCEALCNAVQIHGFSPKYNENDYFLRDARRYWHCFERIDVLDWYMLLGEQIDTISLDKSSEKLFSLLINTRTLMKKVYPELNIEGDDDLARLRERLENEKPDLTVKSFEKTKQHKT
jgi:tetratricopeptide (TPR) repeat protein